MLKLISCAGTFRLAESFVVLICVGVRHYICRHVTGNMHLPAKVKFTVVLSSYVHIYRFQSPSGNTETFISSGFLMFVLNTINSRVVMQTITGYNLNTCTAIKFSLHQKKVPYTSNFMPWIPTANHYLVQLSMLNELSLQGLDTVESSTPTSGKSLNPQQNDQLTQCSLGHPVL